MSALHSLMHARRNRYLTLLLLDIQKAYAKPLQKNFIAEELSHIRSKLYVTQSFNGRQSIKYKEMSSLFQKAKSKS